MHHTPPHPPHHPILLAALTLFGAAALSLGGCSSSATDCTTDEDCFVGEVCMSGTCMVGDSTITDPPLEDMGNTPDQDLDTDNGGTTNGDMPMMDPDMPPSGSDMPSGEDMGQDMEDGDEAANIEVSTLSVDFSDVAVNATARQTFTVRNTGGAPLAISTLALDRNDSPFTVSFPDAGAPDDLSQDRAFAPASLAANSEMLVRVTFEPEAPAPASATVEVETDDADQPRVEVLLLGNTGPACANIDLPTGALVDYRLEFGRVTLNQTARRTVRIENCSARVPLSISDIAITDDSQGTYAFGMGSPGPLPTTIAPDDAIVVEVEYTPNDALVHTGELTLTTSDPTQSTATVRLEGTGTQQSCPTAEAKARVENSGDPLTDNINTIPLKTVAFDSSQSVSGGPPIRGYEWTIVTRPVNSSARLSDNMAASPTLFLDLAGTYVVDLRVRTIAGQSSCMADRVRIVARPDKDVSIQLVWDTPADPDQTDISGTDLDLHYKKQSAAWNSMSGGDVYWNYPALDWGVTGNPSDDPSLDIDDTDGLGPENINHSNVPDGTYNIGVYYYDTKGFGASYATVRVFVRGVLNYEFRDKYMEKEFNFWHVVDLSASNGMLTTTQVDKLYPQGFP